MKKKTGPASLVAALVIGLCLHASSAMAEGSTPESVVKSFAKAYYMLDDTMADYMSEEARVNENDVDMVDLFLRLKEDEARKRGYDVTYLRMHPILMKTTVVEMNEDTAVVNLNTTALRNINPLYRITGYIFGLMKEHEFNATLSLVKEDGMWKVSPGALDPLR
ncbi:MAG: hypothetical protein V6Z89_00560 [Desulfobacter sp.]